MQNKLFKKSSVERFSSPEKLNDYIQVSNPSSWMVLAAALALLVGVLAWGFFGKLTESVSFNGVARQNALRCYVTSEVSHQLEKEMEVVITPFTGEENPESITGKVVAIADYPLSYAEASADIETDYLLAALGIGPWNVVVEVASDAELIDGMVYSISAVTDTQRPIDLVFQ
ncbi:MAG: hypothetical protein IKK75_14885 [Clostridia bacterium]|nr:hypothetical protein [Clostridia bacterium]